MQLSSRTRTPRSWCWRDAHFHSSRARRPLLRVRVCVLLSAHFNAAHQHHRTDKTMHTFITLISAMKAQHAAAAQRRIISYDN